MTFQAETEEDNNHSQAIGADFNDRVKHALEIVDRRGFDRVQTE